MDNSFSKVQNDIQLDIDCFKVNNEASLLSLLSHPGLWVSTQYRLSKWIKIHFKVPILRQFLRFILAIWELISKVLLHCEFPNSAEIGSGISLPHPYCIVIHSDAQIGNNCLISQNVTIGVGGRGERSGVPKIGDRVFIAPGAKIFGSITIGNGVAIGANAVVTKSIPDNAVVGGVPAKIINYKGSQDFIPLSLEKLDSKLSQPVG